MQRQSTQKTLVFEVFESQLRAVRGLTDGWAVRDRPSCRPQVTKSVHTLEQQLGKGPFGSPEGSSKVPSPPPFPAEAQVLNALMEDKEATRAPI